MSLGLLTLGLVHSRGEALPRWIPLLGDRRIPIYAAVVPATVGAIAVALVCTYGALNYFGVLSVSPETLGEARALSAFDVPAGADLVAPGGWVPWFYAPLAAWAPLLAAVTLAYHRRRARPGRYPFP